MLAAALVDNLENQLFCAILCSFGSIMGFFLPKPSLDMMLLPIPPLAALDSSSFEKIEAWSLLVFDLAFCGSRDDRYARADSTLVVAVSKVGNAAAEIACVAGLAFETREAGAFLAFPIVEVTGGDLISGGTGNAGAGADDKET